MKPLKTNQIGNNANKVVASAVFLRPALTVLKQRSDFLRAARGKRTAMAGFVIQVYKRPDGEAKGIRVGYTCSKKVGNAVARNRAKRRLREIANAILPQAGEEDHDYVLIGRKDVTASLPFLRLQDELRKALSILHGPRK